MTGKKDQVLVVVVGGYTKTQAANIQADVMKSKAKHAPFSWATASTGNRKNVGKRLGIQHKNVKQIESKDGQSNGKKK